MRSELAELHRSLQTTFVYVTHDQAEALTMSDRMAVMMDGNILQLGTPDEIYNNPRDIRVAEFVGAPKINLLPGHLDSGGHACCGGVVLTRVAHTASEEITLGLRPEHLSVCDHTDRQALKGRVVHKENLGADIYLHISLQDGAHRMVVRATPVEGVPVSIGTDIAFKRLHGVAMVFDKAGKRIDLTDDTSAAVPEVA
jgi:multiple sugar transport system ATP-binding protein